MDKSVFDPDAVLFSVQRHRRRRHWLWRLYRAGRPRTWKGWAVLAGYVVVGTLTDMTVLPMPDLWYERAWLILNRLVGGVVVCPVFMAFHACVRHGLARTYHRERQETRQKAQE